MEASRIKCKCGNEARVVLREYRYMVECPFCGYSGYLKTFNMKEEEKEPEEGMCEQCGLELNNGEGRFCEECSFSRAYDTKETIDKERNL